MKKNAGNMLKAVIAVLLMVLHLTPLTGFCWDRGVVGDLIEVPVAAPADGVVVPVAVPVPDSLPLTSEGLYQYAVGRVSHIFGYVYSPHLLSGHGAKNYFYVRYSPGAGGPNPEEILRIVRAQEFEITTSDPTEQIEMVVRWEDELGNTLFEGKTMLEPRFGPGQWSLVQLEPLRFKLNPYIPIWIDGVNSVKVVDDRTGVIDFLDVFDFGLVAGRAFMMPAYYTSRGNSQFIVNIGGRDFAFWVGNGRQAPSWGANNSIIAELGDCRVFANTNLIDIRISKSEYEEEISPMIWLTLSTTTVVGFRVYLPAYDQYASSLVVQYGSGHWNQDLFPPLENSPEIFKFTLIPGTYVIRPVFGLTGYGDFRGRFPNPNNGDVGVGAK